MAFSPSFSTRQTRNGFTLIELLVVILIIALMSGFILAAVGGGDDEQKINGGITRLRSMMSLAQSAAISRKQTTRVLIHFDDNDKEKLLRYAIIVYDDNGTWLPYTDGEYLPEGVFFSPALSTGPAGEAPLYLWEASIDLTSATPISPGGTPSTQSNYALNGAGNDPLTHDPGANLWYVYEFAPNGTYNPLSTSGSGTKDYGTRCVVINGLIPLDELIIPQEQEDEVFQRAQGFVLFRSGKPMFFQDPIQIQNGN